MHCSRLKQSSNGALQFSFHYVQEEREGKGCCWAHIFLSAWLNGCVKSIKRRASISACTWVRRRKAPLFPISLSNNCTTENRGVGSYVLLRRTILCFENGMKWKKLKTEEEKRDVCGMSFLSLEIILCSHNSRVAYRSGSVFSSLTTVIISPSSSSSQSSNGY